MLEIAAEQIPARFRPKQSPRRQKNPVKIFRKKNHTQGKWS